MKNFIKYLSVLGLCIAFTSESYAAARQPTAPQKSDSRTTNSNSTKTKSLKAYLSSITNDYGLLINPARITEACDSNGSIILTIPIDYGTSNESHIKYLVDAITKICNQSLVFKGTSSGGTQVGTTKFKDYMTKYLQRKQRTQFVVTLTTDKKLDNSNTNVENVSSFSHTYTKQGSFGGYNCKVYCYARSNSYNIILTKTRGAQIEITLSVPSTLNKN